MSDDYFKSLFDTQILMLNDIKDDIRDLKDDVSNLKTDVAVVKSDVQNVKNEVNDLKQTVTNHINQDIHETNKKRLGNTPNWVFMLLIFMVGRMSISVFDMYDENQNEKIDNKPLVSQSSTFAPTNSTYVSPKKTTNQKIDKKIIDKLLGE